MQRQFQVILTKIEVVVVIFLAGADQLTLPRQMWAGIRQEISPTILAAASILVLISIALLTVVELLRRRSERLRGMSPGSMGNLAVGIAVELRALRLMIRWRGSLLLFY